jgi:hypothetical protein
MKLICIKEEEIEERDDTLPIIFGKIYEGYISKYQQNAWAIKLVDSRFHKIYSKEHFISLAEYRENKLNFLLDDDYSKRQ